MSHSIAVSHFVILSLSLVSQCSLALIFISGCAVSRLPLSALTLSFANFVSLSCLALLSSTPPTPADTKRKVEQISEELRTLDQILSKDENKEETGSDVMDGESVAPTDMPAAESEVKGQFIFVYT